MSGKFGGMSSVDVALSEKCDVIINGYMSRGQNHGASLSFGG